MPWKPKRICSKCGKAVSGRCDCTPRQKEVKRETRTERGYDNRWLRASKTFLSTRPLCSECRWFYRITPAEVTDHKRPHRKDWGLFWDTENWQPLCKRCHDMKTSRENSALAKYVVCGPPGAGKTTWVNSRRKQGDLVFDADYLLAAMFSTPVHQPIEHGAPLVERLRAIVVDWLQNYPSQSAYIIQANEQRAKDTANALGAELVALNGTYSSGLKTTNVQ